MGILQLVNARIYSGFGFYMMSIYPDILGRGHLTLNENILIKCLQKNQLKYNKTKILKL